MMPDQIHTGTRRDEELRDRAIKRLRKKSDFWTHLMVYAAVNAFLVVIWVVNPTTTFWPIFPIVGWGIGVAANAWDAYGPDRLTEERIHSEMDRLR